MLTVLIVENDPQVRAEMTRALSDCGSSVDAVGTAAEALRQVELGRHDLVVLDLGLPDLHGSTALRMIRRASDIPVIVVATRREESAVVRLLEWGADDYMVKPLSGAHLAARMNAVLRRADLAGNRTRATEFSVGELYVNLAERKARLGVDTLHLTRREFDLLAYLAAHSGQLVSRQTLLEKVWQGVEVATSQTIDVHVSWLRRKLGENATAPRYLHTVWGVGLRLVAPS